MLWVACGPQGLNVKSGYAPQFRHLYNTYGIAYDPLVAEDSTLQHDIIVSEIKRQMEQRGFEYDPVRPEVLVFYSFHPNRLKINTYIKSYRYPEQEYVVDNAMLRRGILLIQFQDTFQNKPIWQGYASRVSLEGLFDQKTAKVAAQRILFQYQTFSLEYQRKNRVQ